MDFVTSVDSLYTPINGFSLNPDGMQMLLETQAPIPVSQPDQAAESPLHSKILWAAGAGVLLLWATRTAH